MASLIEHPGAEVMTQHLASKIITALDAAIYNRGQAFMAVSGGSTPGPVHQAISQAQIDWSKVVITLVDDRWVNPGEAGSNETFVQDTLLQNNAEAARFVGLKSSGDHPLEGLAASEARLADLPWPLDVMLLGMGPDGHTASWFPHADGLEAALASDGPKLAAVTARKSEVTGDLVDRITLTRSAMNPDALNLLFMKGQGKKDAFLAAADQGAVEDMPVRALLHDEAFQLESHWCA